LLVLLVDLRVDDKHVVADGILGGQLRFLAHVRSPVGCERHWRDGVIASERSR
jgi:hypothetical protein